MFNPTPRARSFHSIRDDLAMLLSTFIPTSTRDFLELENKAKNYIFRYLPYLTKNVEVDLYPYARTALYCLLKSLNLPKNAEVIISGAHISPYLDVIKALNLRPVIADIENNTFCVDKASLESCLTSNTKVVIITYLFGYVPNINSIFSSIPKDIFIIEDISQGIGGKNKNGYLGNFGNASIMSTSYGKYIDGSGGAILFLKNKFNRKLVKKCKDSYLKKTNFFTNFKRQYRPTLLNLLTYKRIFPILFIIIISLEKSGIYSFKRFGASKKNFQRDKKSLPSFYFKQISPHSMKFIISELPKLNQRISNRLSQVSIVNEHLDYKFGLTPNKLQKDYEKGIKNTYWQLVLKAPTNKSRSKLLPLGIETSCTNLSNLFELLDIKKLVKIKKLYSRKGTDFLYQNTIFFPLSKDLSIKKLKNNINLFNLISSKI